MTEVTEQNTSVQLRLDPTMVLIEGWGLALEFNHRPYPSFESTVLPCNDTCVSRLFPSASQVWSSGAGSFPKQWLIIKPIPI